MPPRQVFASLCFATLFLASPSAFNAGPATAAERPNILMILVDDLKPAIGAYGDTFAKTPHLDALTRRGMRFERAYCNQAVCAPSRFTLMLGSHSTSTGLYGLGNNLRESFPDAVTLPQHFAANGYRTESLGKVFHIGHGNLGDPDSFSVPHFKEKVIEYVDPESTDGGKLTREEAFFTNQKLDRIKSLPRGAAFESPDVDDDAYADGRVAKETIRRLQAAQKRIKEEGTPFFIAAGFARPHLPFSAPKKYWDLYDRAKLPMPVNESLPVGSPSVAHKRGGEISNYKPVPESREANFDDDLKRDLIHGYYASVSYVDSQIGKVIHALDELALDDDTIVVLWGDHGFHLGDLGIWTKHTNYEQANRIPIVFVAPGVTRPGQSTLQPAESVDIFPTLAQLAGIPTPKGPQPIDGISLVPVLKDPAKRVRDHAFHAYPKKQMGRAIRTERYRLVEWKTPGKKSDDAAYELYDYQEDPHETENLASRQPKVVKQLRAMLDRYPEALKRSRGKPRKAAGVDANSTGNAGVAASSPVIANRPLQIRARIKGSNLSGVVLAQGGREHGYALHLVNGTPVFDVRRHGKVTRVALKMKVSGDVTLKASLDDKKMLLALSGGSPVSVPSPGLIPANPKDALSIAMDDQSAAGDYSAPNAFTGLVVNYTVDSGQESRPKGIQLHPREGCWTVDRANRWYDQTRWPLGANFIPSSAINPLEMWQSDTFDPKTIDRELSWAADLGMNTMRVFLHDLAWQQDPAGFLKRVDRYLEIAERHGIRTMFVFFDGVWHPNPKPGMQPAPKPGVHNSGWVQSPGRMILENESRHDELRPYVQAVIQRYRDDDRVLIWDLFNEPNNSNRNSYGEAGSGEEMPAPLKQLRAQQLVEKAFAWAREINPTQPLTVGVWAGNYLTAPTPYQLACLEHSDVISFHTYSGPEQTIRLVEGLKRFGRPIFCTEYMARGNGSTFQSILPIFHRERVAAYNWGFVNGKSQTIFPWDSWDKAYDSEPAPWFHDIFDRDGTVYDPKETRVIRQLSNQPPTQPSAPPPLAPAQPTGEILQGLKSHDRALFVKEGWIRDPYIVRGPDDAYYLTGTTPDEGDPRERLDPYNTGLGPLSLVGSTARVWRSRDLAHWQSLGAPFNLKDGIWAQANPSAFQAMPQKEWRLWAPELHWIEDRWALVHTSPAPVKGANLSTTQGQAVDRPWQNPMGISIGRRHDPSLFRDDDGTWYLVWGATQIAPLKPDLTGLAAKPVSIGPSGETAKMGHEGCLIQKIHDKYVLFGTGWSTGEMRRGSYNLYFATADKLSGPYSERRFVGRFLGHGTPFQAPDGQWWCTAFYNANVPPVNREGIQTRDLSRTAQTINRRGTTIVPLGVSIGPDGKLNIRALDPDYAIAGPDEAQKFDAPPAS